MIIRQTRARKDLANGRAASVGFRLEPDHRAGVTISINHSDPTGRGFEVTLTASEIEKLNAALAEFLKHPA